MRNRKAFYFQVKQNRENLFCSSASLSYSITGHPFVKSAHANAKEIYLKTCHLLVERRHWKTGIILHDGSLKGRLGFSFQPRRFAVRQFKLDELDPTVLEIQGFPLWLFPVNLLVKKTKLRPFGLYLPIAPIHRLFITSINWVMIAFFLVYIPKEK